MTTRFAEGDRVRYTGSWSPQLIGARGTVTRAEVGWDVRVSWDNPALTPIGVMSESLTKTPPFDEDEIYYVTVDGPQASGYGAGSTALVGPLGRHRRGDRVRILRNRYVDANEVRTVAIDGPAEGVDWTISKTQLSPQRPDGVGSAPTLPQPDPNEIFSGSFSSIWFTGNVIQFTASAEVRDGEYVVGCKRIGKDEAQEYLLTEGALRYGVRPITVMGTVQRIEDECSPPCTFVGIKAGDVKISLEEFSAYASDVRLLSRAV